MPTDVARRSRRALLVSAAGGAAALAAAQLAKPAAALADDAPLLLNVENHATLPTKVVQDATDNDALEVVGNGKGFGLKGASTSGQGVLGSAAAATMAGVVGLTADTAGSYYDDVVADPVNNALEAGVYGFNKTGTWPVGVWGESSDDGTGVYGTGGWGVEGWGWAGVVGYGDGPGVHGHGGDWSPNWPLDPAKTGVFATCDAGGVALDARGKVRFDRANKVLIKKGSAKVKKTLTGVTTSSQVFAALRTYRSGVYVAAVVPSAGYFTIYLNKALTADTYASYFVVN